MSQKANEVIQELELYDNQIKKLENLSGLVNLKMLDVSHNMLRRIEGLEELVRSAPTSWKPKFVMKTCWTAFINSLERLYLVSNKISKIENLECCPKLNMLELGDNKIRKVGPLTVATTKGNTDELVV